MTFASPRRLLAALALVSVGGVAAGCTNGTDLVGSVMGKTEAENVPEDTRFIDEPAGAARVAAVTTRRSQVKGLLGPSCTISTAPSAPPASRPACIRS